MSRAGGGAPAARPAGGAQAARPAQTGTCSWSVRRHDHRWPAGRAGRRPRRRQRQRRPAGWHLQRPERRPGRRRLPRRVVHDRRRNERDRRLEGRRLHRPARIDRRRRRQGRHRHRAPAATRSAAGRAVPSWSARTAMSHGDRRQRRCGDRAERIGRRRCSAVESTAGPNGGPWSVTRAGTATGPAGNRFRRRPRGGRGRPNGAVAAAVAPAWRPVPGRAGGSRAGVATGRGGAVAGGTRWVGASNLAGQGAYVRSGFGYYNTFNRGWYAQHPGAWGAAVGWLAGSAWSAASWGSCCSTCGYAESATPYVYDYGDNITYQDGRSTTATRSMPRKPNMPSRRSSTPTPAAPPSRPRTRKWQPLGVFALVFGEETTSDNIFQLAINKDGVVRGNYYNALTDSTQPVFGSLDKKSQRVAWSVGEKKDKVFEAGLYNLTSGADDGPGSHRQGQDRPVPAVPHRAATGGPAAADGSAAAGSRSEEVLTWRARKRQPDGIRSSKSVALRLRGSPDALAFERGVPTHVQDASRRRPVKMKSKEYDRELGKLQTELAKLQEWVEARRPARWSSCSRAATGPARAAPSGPLPNGSARGCSASSPCRPHRTARRRKSTASGTPRNFPRAARS